MGLFEKLIALPPLQPYLQMEDELFVEDPGWREVLKKVKQLKRLDTLLRMIQDAAPVREKEKMILGYLCTLAAETSESPVELPCVEYGGCYLSRGSLILKNPSEEFQPSYVGMGMNAFNPNTQILVQGNVGDYLGYRSPVVRIEVKGSARDRVGMAVGEGSLKIEGDVQGGLAGNAQSTRMEVEGSVGRINRENMSCTFLIGGDVHWGIGEKQADCFIKVCGNIGMKYKKSGRLVDVAAGMTKNSVLLVGGDVYGHLGKNLELARIYVWGKVHGDIRVSDAEGGFIYLNKKSTSLIKRLKRSIGSDIGIKYVSLKDSGYLFVESAEEVKDLVVS